MHDELNRWLRFAVAAGIYRFRFTSWRGPTLLIVSILDVLVYAGALYVVMAAVFEFSGVERFVTMLVGLVPLRWSIGCALHASRVANFAKVCAPVYARPVLATTILAMGPSTTVFLISIVLVVIGLAVLPASTTGLGHMIAWALFVILVHLSWNVLLVLAIIYARMRHILLSEGPIIFAFLLLFILSPITYQFSDIPATASQILTSMNPASHLIAAYQNALWFDENVSLQVLPLSAVASLAAALLLPRVFRVRRRPYAVGVADKPTHRLSWNGRFWHYSDTTADRDTNALAFRSWGGDVPWITGANLLYLLGAPSRDVAARMEIFGALVLKFDSAQLLDAPLPVYAERVRNRLCIVIALSGPSAPIVLDRLLDGEDRESLIEFCRVVASRRFGRGDLVVLSANKEVANTLVGYAPSGDLSISQRAGPGTHSP